MSFCRTEGTINPGKARASSPAGVRRRRNQHKSGWISTRLQSSGDEGDKDAGRSCERGGSCGGRMPAAWIWTETCPSMMEVGRSLQRLGGRRVGPLTP